MTATTTQLPELWDSMRTHVAALVWAYPTPVDPGSDLGYVLGQVRYDLASLRPPSVGVRDEYDDGRRVALRGTLAYASGYTGGVRGPTVADPLAVE